ncbi:MAG: hypothetical protein LBM28_07155 [Oscillospiraceae bacterium]|jgi:hypothetical protein|nr:hypothetical protein [Oscillospiraceae bacterium]
MKKPVLLFALFALCFGLFVGCKAKAPAAYMAPIDAYCAALQNNDFEQLRLSMPATVLNSDGINPSELDDLRTAFVKDWGSVYTLTAKEKSAKSLSPADIVTLEDYLYDEYGYRTELTQAYNLEVTLTFRGNVSGTMDVPVVVYYNDRVWYLDFNASALDFAD